MNAEVQEQPEIGYTSNHVIEIFFSDQQHFSILEGINIVFWKHTLHW